MSTAVQKAGNGNLVEAVRAQAAQMRPEFQKALPSHIPVERFERVVLTAINRNPELLECDRRMLWNECTLAAHDGLMPDGREAALVIFNKKIKDNGQERWIKVPVYMPMIGGIHKKARQSGEVALLNGHVVYQSDRFKIRYGDDPGVDHEPALEDRGKALGAYSVVKFSDGTIDVEWMPAADIARVQAISKAKDKQGNATGPWRDWWDEMWRKTVVRRLCKRVPMSAELHDVISRDDQLYDLDKAAESALPAPPRPVRTEYIEHRVETETQEMDNAARAAAGKPPLEDAGEPEDAQEGDPGPGGAEEPESPPGAPQPMPEGEISGYLAHIKAELAECESLEQVDGVAESVAAVFENRPVKPIIASRFESAIGVRRKELGG